MEMPWIATAFIFLLAGIIKGILGLGLPTIAMGLLGLIMPPAQAAGLLVLPSVLTNVVQAAAGGPIGPLLGRLRPLLFGIVTGTVAGALVLPAATGPWATALLGIALVVSAGLNLLRFQVRVSTRHEPLPGLSAGTATGLVTVATGVFIIPAVAYLRALDLPRDSFVRALGISFTTSSVTLGAALMAQGVYRSDVALGSVLLLLPTLLGVRLGTVLRQRLDGDRFRSLFDVSLLLLGLVQIGLALRP